MVDVALERLHAQHLVRPLGSPAEVVAHLLAVQAQDYPGARWAVGQRARGATDADVIRAYDAGEILRTHVMRPTWHFVAPGDLRWLLALTSPRVHAVNAHYYKQHGLTAAKLARTDQALVDALRGGHHLTRAELGERLGLEASGNLLAYVMMHAELEALIVSGPCRGKQFTYALLDERVPATTPRTRDEALGELARRYVTSHGPAQVKDLAWWSGLTQADARRATELAALAAIEVDGVEHVHVPAKRRSALADPIVHLLPNYDECLIAFADRSAARDARVEQADLLAAHFVMSNGRLIGGFRRTQQKREVAIECAFMLAPTAAELDALHAEVERLGRFLGVPVRLSIAGKKRALARRKPAR